MNFIPLLKWREATYIIRDEKDKIGKEKRLGQMDRVIR